MLSSHGHHALDIKLVLRHRGQTRERTANARGFKDQNFSAFRSPEIVTQSINEKMVSITDLQLDKVVPFAIQMFLLDTGIVEQKGLLGTDPGPPWRQILHGQPDIMPFAADPKRLSAYEWEDLLRRLDFLKHSIGFRDHVTVGNATPDKVQNASPAAGNPNAGFVSQVLADDAVQRRLHRTSRDFEGLQKIRADAHRHHNRHQNHLTILPPVRCPCYRCQPV